jgi:hypothetical protein
MDERSESAIRNLESGNRIELFYEDFPEATIRATVNRLLSDRDEGMAILGELHGFRIHTRRCHLTAARCGLSLQAVG